MESTIYKHVPETWNSKYGTAITRVPISRNTAEYGDIENMFRAANFRVKTIHRYENVWRYGQFLVRQQHLLALNSGATFYTSRRFVTILDNEVDNALEYQLDNRRLSGNVSFNTSISGGYGQTIFVVAVITSAPQFTFNPTRDTDFYIEYIVKME